jgi:hypothetical protein
VDVGGDHHKYVHLPERQRRGFSSRRHHGWLGCGRTDVDGWGGRDGAGAYTWGFKTLIGP